MLSSYVTLAVTLMVGFRAAIVGSQALEIQSLHFQGRRQTSEGKWVIFEKKVTPKIRKLKYENFTLYETAISNEIYLGKKRTLGLASALRGVKTKTSRLKRSLNSEIGQPTVVLPDRVVQTQSQEIRRSNITCGFTEQYSFRTPITEQVLVPCWDAPHIRCLRYQVRYVTATRQRTIQKCCPGYQIGAQGFCDPVIRVQPTVKISSTCGASLTAIEGVVTSPAYPNYYGDLLDCKWTIRGAIGQKIAMKIVDLHLEDAIGACDLSDWRCFDYCEYDVLNIHDVTSRRNKALCGSRAPISEFVSAGNSVEVTFKSDVSSGGRGFKIIYAITTDRQLSATRHRCVGGQEWNICHRRCAHSCARRGNQTTLPCFDRQSAFTHIRPMIPVSRFDETSCVPGCACPPSRPYWHEGACIKVEFCPPENGLFQCGKPAVPTKLKIVGGRTSDKAAWPWMVQLETDLFSHICGATLICSDWVVTAAHCFLNFDGDGIDSDIRGYVVSVGKHWKHSDQEDGRIIQTFQPRKIVIHERYVIKSDGDVDVNDIALIMLPRAVQVTDYVRPACLPTARNTTFGSVEEDNSPRAGTVCKVLGWGISEGVGPKPNRLKQASISIRPSKSCDYESYDERLMICAGGHKDKDTCRGDSGGPLLCNREGRWVLDGITSFGDSCGEAGVAGGYVRVSSYMHWIQSHVGYRCLH